MFGAYINEKINCNIIIKSISEYSYLWPIINDATSNFDKVYLCVDDDLNFKFNNNINIIKFDKNLTYASRLVSILKNMDCDYILLIHDVDIILNFDNNIFNKYLNIVKCNNIDRLSLGVFMGNNIIEEDTLKICKLEKNMSINFLTPYDYAPSIYSRIKILDFYQNFNTESYKNLEHNELAQSYIINNLNCYGIQKNENLKLIYHRGFVYTSDFNFLHLTISGKFMNQENYFDLIDDFNKIKNKYNLNLPTQYYNLLKQEI